MVFRLSFIDGIEGIERRWRSAALMAAVGCACEQMADISPRRTLPSSAVVVGDYAQSPFTQTSLHWRRDQTEYDAEPPIVADVAVLRISAVTNAKRI